MIAASNGEEHVLKLLIDSHADLNLQDNVSHATFCHCTFNLRHYSSQPARTLFHTPPLSRKQASWVQLLHSVGGCTNPI